MCRNVNSVRDLPTSNKYTLIMLHCKTSCDLCRYAYLYPTSTTYLVPYHEPVFLIYVYRDSGKKCTVSTPRKCRSLATALAPDVRNTKGARSWSAHPKSWRWHEKITAAGVAPVGLQWKLVVCAEKRWNFEKIRLLPNVIGHKGCVFLWLISARDYSLPLLKVKMSVFKVFRRLLQRKG